MMQSPGPARAAADGMPADVDDMVGMFQEDDGTVQGERREHSPTTKRALANYETYHGLPSGKASVDQV